MNCPRCESTHLRWRGKRHALYPVGLAWALGWVIAMLHRVSSPHEYCCRDCGREFAARRTAGKVGLAVLIAFVVFWSLLQAALYFRIVH
jgi:hypothetical protein